MNTGYLKYWKFTWCYNDCNMSFSRTGPNCWKKFHETRFNFVYETNSRRLPTWPKKSPEFSLWFFQIAIHFPSRLLKNKKIRKRKTNILRKELLLWKALQFDFENCQFGLTVFLYSSYILIARCGKVPAESNPFRSIEFLSREITPRSHISR